MDHLPEGAAIPDGGPAVITAEAVVPYVIAYSGEDLEVNLTFVADAWALNGLRLSYTDPTPSDWDLAVLWARQKTHRRGEVLYTEMHTRRQKECMLGRLCQICQGPATGSGGRLTWVFHEELPAASGRLSKPPVCRACLPDAVGGCPYLRRQAHIYTSGDYELWGVKGITISPTSGATGQQDVPLNDPRTLEFTLALTLIVHVQDMRPEPPP